MTMTMTMMMMMMKRRKRKKSTILLRMMMIILILWFRHTLSPNSHHRHDPHYYSLPKGTLHNHSTSHHVLISTSSSLCCYSYYWGRIEYWISNRIELNRISNRISNRNHIERMNYKQRQRQGKTRHDTISWNNSIRRSRKWIESTPHSTSNSTHTKNTAKSTVLVL